jgi:uncharacterized damage-inducible protein DinB
MNYYGAKELAAAFRTVRNNTIKIAEEIPEDKYAFQASSDTRPVGRLLVHIALSNGFSYQMHGVQKLKTLVGFDFGSFMAQAVADEQKSRTKAEIIQLLREGGDRFATMLEGLSDDYLAEEITFPAGAQPPSKSRFEMLLGAKEHEMHHRGQLMMMERMIGIVPHLTRDQQARMAAMQAAAKG